MTHHITDEQNGQIAEQVGLVGPASRVGDCHAASLRFARALLDRAAPAPQGEPVSAALSDIVALWDLDAPLRYNEALHMQAKRALAGEQPVSPDLNRWCVYVAGIISGWLEIARPQIMSMGDEARTQAIAGIIERRLWAMPKDTAPAPAVPGDVVLGYTWTDHTGQHRHLGRVPPVTGAYGIEPVGRITAAPTPPAQAELPIELADVGRQIEEGKGIWCSCTGCHDSNEGVPTGPFSRVFQCHLGLGCSECGGLGAIWDDSDYEGMAAFMASSDSEPAQPAVPESADSVAPVQLGELAKRNVYDAIRGAYDLGYNDARNARAVPGDSAPDYEGRSVEADHGGALINSLNRRLRSATAIDAARKAGGAV